MIRRPPTKSRLVSEVMRSDLSELMQDAPKPLVAHPEAEAERLMLDDADWPMEGPCECADG